MGSKPIPSAFMTKGDLAKTTHKGKDENRLIHLHSQD